MKICTNHIQSWLKHHPTLSQWLWFVGLWLLGLTGAMLLALPVKMLVRSM